MLFSFNCDGHSKKAKLAHQAMSNTIKTLEDRYQLHPVAISEAADDHFYTEIGLQFQIFHPLNKEEGRKILIDSAEELLKEINSMPGMLQYLQPSPFTPYNIEIMIFSYQPNGERSFYPNILTLVDSGGIIRYSTKTPGMEFGYHTVEEETYEEALKIVQAHKQAEQTNEE